MSWKVVGKPVIKFDGKTICVEMNIRVGEPVAYIDFNDFAINDPHHDELQKMESEGAPTPKYNDRDPVEFTGSWPEFHELDTGPIKRLKDLIPSKPVCDCGAVHIGFPQAGPWHFAKCPLWEDHR